MKAIQSIKKGLAMVLAAALVIGGLYIPADTVNAASVPERVLSLQVGQQQTIFVTADDLSGSDGRDVTWESTDPQTVCVTATDGKPWEATIKAMKLSNETVTITAKNDDVACKTWKVTVTPASSGSQPQIKINPTSVELSASKKSATLTAIVTPGNGTVSWSSSAPSVLVTPGDGKTATVTATDTTAAKTATITATVTANGEIATATCTVKIIADGTPNVPVQGITLNKTSLSLKVGGSETLIATVAPATATNKGVTWESSDPAIATVAAGVVTAKGVGTATITATAGNKTATCTVTVTAAATKVPVTGVSLNAKTLVVGKGATRALTATVAPANATNKTVAWKSSATAIATVDAKGNVKGIKKGTATITATTADGNKTATCTVTVTEVTLNSTALTLGFGQSSTALKATLSNAKADRLTSWKTSNAAIVKVDARTGKLTAANKAGTANITVTTQAGATATCRVTVKLMTTKLTMSKTKLELAKGKSATLKVTRTPGNATEKITWSSSNPKVATVTQKGKVSAKKTGTVTITAQAANGVKATCKVTIKKASLKLKKAKGTVKVGKSLKIQVKSSFPKKDKIKSYKSSNSKIAKVDKKGKVTGKKKGTAKITVTTKSGAKATFKVTVKK